MSFEKNICIIGCGIAGISALRVFSEEIKRYPINYSLTAFEKTDDLGGLWNYSENLNNEWISPIYKHMKTNLPKEIMAYPDFPFSDDIYESFVHHEDVLNYLQSYVKYYDLEKYIEYNSEVINVDILSTTDSTNSGKWQVTIRNSKCLTTFVKLFDIILICNGHFEKPRIPEINGLQYFQGECIHSKYYKIPENYLNKIVLILGAKSSGLDITIQLLNVAKKVYLSHSGNRFSDIFQAVNFEEVYEISHIDCNGKVIMTDGLELETDAILFCTGYEITFNFLNNSSGLQYSDNYVRPLYNHMINPFFPTNFFIIGLGYEIIPFVHCYLQCKVARSIIQNCHKSISLSTQNLIEEIVAEEKAYKTENISKRHRHYFNSKEWVYFEWCRTVSENIMTANIPNYLESIFEMVKTWRFTNINFYKNNIIRLAPGTEQGYVIK